MTTTITLPHWEAKRTDETRMVETRLRAHFQEVDAYRYNSASIRVRVIDPRFEGKKREQRDAMVEAELDKLPPETQRDIVTLFTFAPSELVQTPKTFREYVQNTEFDDPTPSML
jgi:stress-induced morphogen